MSPPQSVKTPTDPPSPSRREWVFVLLVMLAGLIIRGAAPANMAVEHFDEGVYASNIWFGAKQRFRYPARHLYAPPFVPALAEWSQILLGPTHWGTMLPGILSGTMTIFVCWWCVRRWFGPTAGLAAATLAASSDYHVLYSRTILTEPVLCLCLLAAVFLIWRALVKKDLRWAVVAGLCTGLAWITKYNGWLPLAIGLTGLSAWSIFPPKGDLRSRRFLVLGVTALMALVVVFPVWWGLQGDGGYSAVQENHARYLVGLSGWMNSWKRQLAQHQFLDGPLSWVGLFFAVSISGFMSRSNRAGANAETRKRLQTVAWTAGCAGGTSALAMWLGSSLVLGLLGGGWLLWACPVWRKTGKDDSPLRNLAYWLVAAWFVGLFLATPLYTPYPRLSLPWLVAAWITAAAMLGSSPAQKLLTGENGWQSNPLGKVALAMLAVIGLSGVGARFAMGIDSFSPWQDRTGLECIASRIQNLILQKYGGRADVYVYAEPGLYYHLRADEVSAVPVANLQFSQRHASVPILLVVGPHAERSPNFQEEWQTLKSRFERLGHFPYAPSDLVLLNHYSPEEIRDPNFQREQSIQLYLTKPP